jgi:hypothetical protein
MPDATTTTATETAATTSATESKTETATTEKTATEGSLLAGTETKTETTDGKAKATETPPEIAFKLPEGFKDAADFGGALKEAAKKNGLSSAQAQAVADLHVGVLAKYDESIKADFKAAMAKQEEDSLKAVKKEWGDKFDANRTLVQRTFKQFGTPAFENLLKEHGLTNNPELVKVFLAMGEATSEDTLGTTTQPPNATPRDTSDKARAHRLYEKVDPKQ